MSFNRHTYYITSKPIVESSMIGFLLLFTYIAPNDTVLILGAYYDILLNTNVLRFQAAGATEVLRS